MSHEKTVEARRRKGGSWSGLVGDRRAEQASGCCRAWLECHPSPDADRRAPLKIRGIQGFEPEHGIMRTLAGPDNLIELQLNRRTVAVLSVLDQGHHKKGDDRSARIDD